MAESIKKVIQDMIPADVELMQGTVIAVNPLRIRMVNDEKLVINERICIVPWHLTNYQQTCDMAQGKDGLMSYTITVHNALKVGEKVHVLSLNKGKLYYVLDRVVT